MENSIYSSNSNQAIMKDTGPFKIVASDRAIKGQQSFEYKKVIDNFTVGKEIKTDFYQKLTKEKIIEIYKA